MHLTAVQFHQVSPVGLRLVRGPHLPHLDVQSEHRPCERESAAPLARSGLGRELGYALHMVVIRLRYSRVGLMAPDRACAFILQIDARAGVQRMFQT